MVYWFMQDLSSIYPWYWIIRFGTKNGIFHPPKKSDTKESMLLHINLPQTERKSLFHTTRGENSYQGQLHFCRKLTLIPLPKHSKAHALTWTVDTLVHPSTDNLFLVRCGLCLSMKIWRGILLCVAKDCGSHATDIVVNAAANLLFARSEIE